MLTSFKNVAYHHLTETIAKVSGGGAGRDGGGEERQEAGPSPQQGRPRPQGEPPGLDQVSQETNHFVDADGMSNQS